MARAIHLLSAASAALTLVLSAGCGAAHVVRLSTPPGGIESVKEPIARCSERQGFMVARHDDAVHVKVADNAWVYFNTDIDNRLQMVLHFMGPHAKARPSDPIARDARAKADAIWACARGARVASPPAARAAPAVAQPTSQPPPPIRPAPANPPAATRPNACAQLIACYLDITRLLCHGASSCKSEVKVKGNPDEAGCREMLRTSDALLAPLRLVRPSLRQPDSCKLR